MTLDAGWDGIPCNSPALDANTVVKVEDGPEDGIPHFYSDEATIDNHFGDLSVVSLRLVQDIAIGGKRLDDSWHNFMLAGKEIPG